jgi:hypothetical protein
MRRKRRKKNGAMRHSFTEVLYPIHHIRKTETTER